MKNGFQSFIIAFTVLLFGCSHGHDNICHMDSVPGVYPDYRDVVYPCNMAAPTFAIAEEEGISDAIAVFTSGSKCFTVESSDGDGICIDQEDWEELVAASDEITVEVQGEAQGKWNVYKPFSIYISRDSIDSYLAYRLIEPGYEVWNKLGLYQRDLSSYKQSEILENDVTNGGCMNCHNFCNNDADNMLFHLRAEYSGTYMKKNGKLKKLVQRDGMPSYVYPSWHPSARYIAFSQNNTKQMFHTTDRNRIEVFDYESDIVVYDTETDEVFTVPQLHSSSAFETFPCWSPDGKSLYFCSADSVAVPDEYDKVRYSICKIDFDEKTRAFGTDVDTIVNAHVEGKTAVFPKISSNGRFLMYTVASYGNFTIWHKESHLCMLDLKSGKREGLDMRASYHSWSSNAHWIVCSSRCDDGLYTRPYILHIDSMGNMSKPFVLPQSDAFFYDRTMKSFNVPEFVKSKVEVDIKQVIK